MSTVCGSALVYLSMLMYSGNLLQFHSSHDCFLRSLSRRLRRLAAALNAISMIRSLPHIVGWQLFTTVTTNEAPLDRPHSVTLLLYQGLCYSLRYFAAYEV
ncbi:hypothetical protein RND81_02G037900 [Saponaria officinalis]|uniref:Secreted protein n=1 Tax=Saponaria officinalis TaxID=3572 RepID=A0AAW1MV36_SAPOF